MPKESPEVIYRYQPIRPDATDLLRTGRLWFSNPSRFNDPFDFLPDFSADVKEWVDKDREEAYWTDPSIRGSRKSFMKGTEAESDRRVREYCRLQRVDYMKGLGENFFVTCFSEVPDIILMWSHYAFYHTGFCIGIRPAKMRLSPEKAIRWKVRYRDERLPINHKRPNEIALRKAKVWKYEREWRVVMATGDLTRGDRWDAIESVRLGALVDRKKRSEVLKVLKTRKRRHIEIIQMHLSTKKFALEEEVLREGN
jgi:hypothetical protein